MEVVLIALFLLVVMAGLVLFGYVLAHDKLADDLAELAQQRQALDVEWRALENSRRVNDVFFQARQAIREAERERRSRP